MSTLARQALDSINKRIRYADEEIVQASQRLSRLQADAQALRADRTYWERIVQWENEGKFP